jgi:hypothetical protein
MNFNNFKKNHREPKLWSKKKQKLQPLTLTESIEKEIGLLSYIGKRNEFENPKQVGFFERSSVYSLKKFAHPYFPCFSRDYCHYNLQFYQNRFKWKFQENNRLMNEPKKSSLFKNGINESANLKNIEFVRSKKPVHKFVRINQEQEKIKIIKSEEKLSSFISSEKERKMSVLISERTESLKEPWVKEHLPNLFNFLISLFNYEKVHHKVSLLSQEEGEILIAVIKSKDYLNKEFLIDTIKMKEKSVRSTWTNFKKTRRKEEYLKYGFKMIFKQLQSQFIESREKLKNKFFLSNEGTDKKLSFYLFHFGEFCTGKVWKDLIQDLVQGKTSKVRLWKKMKKFIVPEMGISLEFCGVKTINKDFIKNICQLRSFSLSFFDRVIDTMLFFGYCSTVNSENEISLKIEENNGFALLKTISKTNQKEIKKLFSEWTNLVKHNKKKEPKDIQNIENEKYMNFKKIKKSLQRTNLKFPWSFIEIWESAIETFLSFAEFINFNHLSDATRSKFII